MRPSIRLATLAVLAIGYCLHGAGPVGAADSGGGLQRQEPSAQTSPVQAAGAAASSGPSGPAPGRPLLIASDGVCEKRMEQWNRWFAVCLMDCKAEATAFDYKLSHDPSLSVSKRFDSETCLNACKTKFNYYKDDICG